MRFTHNRIYRSETVPRYRVVVDMGAFTDLDCTRTRRDSRNSLCYCRKRLNDVLVVRRISSNLVLFEIRRIFPLDKQCGYATIKV